MSNQGNPRIRVATSLPGLKDKVRVDLNGAVDTIYWYIRFNIPLDEESVNHKTMEVMDTDGYIMRTDITYQSSMNRIVISPLDSYEEKRFYVLNISKYVRSAKGQHLRTKIHILFKLYQGEISEYKILRQDIAIPSPKPRPDNYDLLQSKRTPNHLDHYMDNPPKTTMIMEDVRVKLWLGILGLILTLLGFLTFSVPMMIVGAVMCAGGVAHIYIQLRDNAFRSKIMYNKGVKKFNRMQYKAALTFFERALNADPNNELAKYGVVRANLYK